mmetsp:Transcript_17552/g.35248  ORF Transcript_17552/g.35248 Transcript_17552/m.35248 type:complete len:262 (-) Transcript_17552:846-1631(-)
MTKASAMVSPSSRPSLSLAVTSALLLLSHGADGFATHPTITSTVRSPVHSRYTRQRTELSVGSSIDPDSDQQQSVTPNNAIEDGPSSNVRDDNPLQQDSSPKGALWSVLTGGGPPLQVDDTNLLLYDAFLILNLSASISFWVVHRMNFLYIASSLNEGALLCICWILAGLANGAFLYSAVDGHYDPDGDDAAKGGPKAAGLLGLSTFIGTSSIRVLIALILAVLQHRPVGSGGEQLIPLEILVGLVLMSSWRALHSAYTPR